MRLLDIDWERTKAKYFPTYPEPYDFRDGGVIWLSYIRRHDGEPVPEDVYEAYSAWQNQEKGENITFDFGTEYYQQPVLYRQVAWYAWVPDEFLSDEAKAYDDLR